MRHFFLSVFIIGLTLQAVAQADSLAIVQAKWHTRKLAKGATWKAVHFTGNSLFNANQYINMVELAPRRRHVRLAVAYSDSLQTTSQLAMSRKAVAAINGSFFRMRGADPDHRKDLTRVPRNEPAKLDHNRSVVYLRADNKLISEQHYTKDSVRLRHQQGVVAIGAQGVSVLKADTTSLGWERELQAHDVMSSGPVMLIGGNRTRIPDDAFCNDRHPRTAVGRKADGTVVLFVVDGRAQESAGMSIEELQRTLYWLGCVDAINLDGGGSSTLYIRGQPYHGVVNHPSDNKRFDHEGEREVANVLLLLENE